jgi:hypothetical protein
MPEYSFREFHQNQQLTLARAIQAYQAYLETTEAGRPLAGGMHWKKIKDREYLYKYRNRYGHGRSLGPRSAATELLFSEFRRERRELRDRLARQRQRLAEAARFCRAALIHRVPDLVTRVLRRLDCGGLPEASLLVIGTQALHALEFAAGAFIDTPRTSSFWSGGHTGLTLAVTTEISRDRLLSMLRRADRSFRALPGPGLAVINQHGFLLKCLRPPVARSPQKFTVKDAKEALVPAESGDLAALVSAPKFSQVVIGHRGDPVTMVVPDPRALALHKLWLSQQEDRGPARRLRDRRQALALAELILRYLPQYHFFSAELHLFPAEVVRRAEALVEGYEFPGGLEVEY